MSLDLASLLNPEQYKAASQIEGPELIIAGAGSGKTRMITYRIAYMLSKGIDQSEILALTFTNKAAKEMAERVRDTVGKKLERLTTTTFHSFGLGLLKMYIQYLGYRNDFTLYDENDNMIEKPFNMENFYLDFHDKKVDVCYDKCYTTTYTKDNNILTIDDFDYFSGKFEVSYKDNMMLLKTVAEGAYIIYYFGKPIDAE